MHYCLKNVTVKIQIGQMIGVTTISASPFTSSLFNPILFKGKFFNTIVLQSAI